MLKRRLCEHHHEPIAEQAHKGKALCAEQGRGPLRFIEQWL